MGISAAGVTVNAVATTPDTNGLFSEPVPLSEGPNVIVASALDGAGRAGRDRVVVWRDTQAPQLQITNPESNTRLGISGDLSGAATIEVTGIVDIDNEPNLAQVTIATDALCRYIEAKCPIRPLHWFIEANFSGDKKSTYLGLLTGRGRKVTASVKLPAQRVERGLHVSVGRMIG